MFGTNRARLGSIVAVAGTFLGLWAATAISPIAFAKSLSRLAVERNGDTRVIALDGMAQAPYEASRAERPRRIVVDLEGVAIGNGGIPEDRLRRTRRGSDAGGIPGRARQDGDASRGHPRGRRRLRRHARRRAPAAQRASRGPRRRRTHRRRTGPSRGREPAAVSAGSGRRRNRLPRRTPVAPAKPATQLVAVEPQGFDRGHRRATAHGRQRRRCRVFGDGGIAPRGSCSISRACRRAPRRRSPYVESPQVQRDSHRCARREGARRVRRAETPLPSISAGSCPWPTVSSSRSAVARWSNGRSRRRRAKCSRRSRRAPGTGSAPSAARSSAREGECAGGGRARGRREHRRTGGGGHQGSRGGQAGCDSGEARHAAARSDRSERRHDRRARRGRPARRQGIRRAPHLARLQGRRHPRRAASDRGRVRPQHHRRRRGLRERDDPPGRRSLGPGTRRDPADQGPRLRARGQRAAHRARRHAEVRGRGAAPGAARQGEARRPRRQAAAGELRERQGSPEAGQATAHAARHRRHRRAHQHRHHQGHRVGDRRGDGAHQGDRHPDAAGDDRGAHRRGQPRLLAGDRPRVGRGLAARRGRGGLHDRWHASRSPGRTSPSRTTARTTWSSPIRSR